MLLKTSRPVGKLNPPKTDGAIKSRDEAEAAAAFVTADTILLTEELAEQNRKEMLAREHDTTIGQLRERIAKQEARLKEWAEKNRPLFGEKQSLDLRQATLQFKRNPAHLELVKGWEWPQVLEKLLGKTWGKALEKLMSKGLRGYVRVKVEVNKQKVLADAKPDAGLLSEKRLQKLGLVVVSEEVFSVEPYIDVPMP